MADEPTNGRVTVTQLYSALESLEAKLLDRLDRLESTMRENYASRDLCDERHNGYERALADAVATSQDDRSKIWAAVHSIEAQLKWGAGIIIAAFLGIVVTLIQKH